MQRVLGVLFDLERLEKEEVSNNNNNINIRCKSELSTSPLPNQEKNV